MLMLTIYYFKLFRKNNFYIYAYYYGWIYRFDSFSTDKRNISSCVYAGFAKKSSSLLLFSCNTHTPVQHIPAHLHYCFHKPGQCTETRSM